MELLSPTHSEKVSYLVDVQGYELEEIQDLGELCLDDIIITNKWTDELFDFTK